MREEATLAVRRVTCLKTVDSSQLSAAICFPLIQTMNHGAISGKRKIYDEISLTDAALFGICEQTNEARQRTFPCWVQCALVLI